MSEPIIIASNNNNTENATNVDKKVEFDAATTAFFTGINTNLLATELNLFLIAINKRLDQPGYSRFVGRYQRLCEFIKEYNLIHEYILGMMQKDKFITKQSEQNLDFSKEADIIAVAGMEDKSGVIKSFFSNEINILRDLIKLE